MFKKSIFILLAILSTTAMAQTPYFQSPKKTTAAPGAARLAPMSPADFSSQVSKTNAQNQATFKQKLDQKVSAIPAPKIITPPKDAFGKPNLPAAPSAPPKAGTAAPAASTDLGEDDESTATTPEAPQEHSATPLPPTMPVVPVTPRSTTTTPPAPRAPAYTGFGSGQQQPAATPAGGNKNSGGWNVKY